MKRIENHGFDPDEQPAPGPGRVHVLDGRTRRLGTAVGLTLLLAAVAGTGTATALIDRPAPSAPAPATTPPPAPSTLKPAPSTTLPPAPSATLAPAPLGSTRFVPVDVTRIIDTRNQEAVGDEATWRFDASLDPVPANQQASAVVVAVTAGSGGPGDVTVWATGLPRPDQPSLTIPADSATVTALVAVPRDGTGSLSVWAPNGCSVTLDVVGWLEPVPFSGAGRLVSTDVSLATVTAGDGEQAVPLAGVTPPSGVGALVVEVVAAGGASASFYDVWPSERPSPAPYGAKPGPGPVRTVQIVENPGSRTLTVRQPAAGTLHLRLLGWYTDGTAPVEATGLRLAPFGVAPLIDAPHTP